MTLYLKYRPKNLDELDLQDVGESLKKILSKPSVPHAFLFAGPKGTGKTSAARILAKIVNCEAENPPCGKCDQCVSIEKGNNFDVIEMDAASHRGIDDVRILRDAVKLAPVSSKKKVYIIDEAHMLTTEASNALLKTLEEPPEHVIFILATTNPEKLIDTIKSRTTYIPFRKAKPDEIVRSLKRVVLGEKIKIDDEALKIIADASDGSFRDGIKILEQLVAEEKELTKELLEEFLFKKKDFDIPGFILLLTKKDAKSLIEEIGKFGEKGVTIETFLESLLRKLRLSLLAKVTSGPKGLQPGGVWNDEMPSIDKMSLINLIELLEKASMETKESLIEELPLEIAVIKWCDGDKNLDVRSLNLDNDEKHGEQQDSPVSVMTSPDSKLEILNSNTVNDFDAQTIVPEIREPSADLLGGASVNDDAWKNILSLVKPINASVEALLRSSKPMTYDGKVLTLGVYYKFHKERLEDSRHRRVLEEIVGKVLQSPTKVVCVLVDPPPKKVIEETKVEAVLTEGKDRDIIKAAEEIFGN